MKLEHNFQMKVIHLSLAEVIITFATEVREVRPQLGLVERELSTAPSRLMGSSGLRRRAV